MLSGVLVVLTVVGLVVSTAAFWARGVVFEEEEWIDTIRDLPRQEEVAIALADYLTGQLFIAVDFEARLEDALPDEVSVIVPVLTSATRGFIADEVSGFIQSDGFETLWVTANREAHRLLIALLDEQPILPGLERSDDEITLDLLPAINALLDLLEGAAGGIVGSDVALPDIDDSQSTEATIQALGERLGVDLPDDFGQIVIYQGDKLPQPRDTIVLIERIRVAAVLATILLGALAILVAPNRRRAMIGLLVGSAVGFGLLLLGPGALRDAVGDLISDEQNQDAARAAVNVVFDSYISLYRWMLATALFSAATIYLSGGGRVARRVRRAVRTRVDRLSFSTDVGEFLTRYVLWLRIGGVVVAALLLLLFTRRSLASLFVTLALIAAWESALSLVPPTPRARSADS